MGKGWGYRNKASLCDTLLRSKSLINETDLGTKIYKSSVSLNTIEVILHDNRKTNINKSIAIIKTIYGTKVLEVTENFKSFKQVYSYICNWLEYNIWKL